VERKVREEVCLLGNQRHWAGWRVRSSGSVGTVGMVLASCQRGLLGSLKEEDEEIMREKRVELDMEKGFLSIKYKIDILGILQAKISYFFSIMYENSRRE